MGNTQKDRVQNWYNHFKNSLGNLPDIGDAAEDGTLVTDDLDIKVGPFDQQEYDDPKESLVEEKM